MVTSLQILLEDIFDYAGLFPPAALPMDQATDLFARYREGSERWVTQRFVCPVAWLPELLPHLEKLPNEPWPLTVLGSSLEGFRQDLGLIERFESEAADRVEILGYEVKAKPLEVHSSHLVPLINAGFDEIFLELPWTDEGFDALPSLAEFDVVGAKARTGGLEASAFPEPSLVARWIRECIDLGLMMKMTAGLHHPIRHYNESVETKMLGFINVLAAGTLAESEDLSTKEIQEILEIEDPSAFEFSEDGLVVQGRVASLDDIGVFREGFRSIGSCSIEEPLDDLKALGWTNKEVAR